MNLLWECGKIEKTYQIIVSGYTIRGINVAINRLQSEAKNSTLAISTITEIELILGYHNKVELQQLRKFLRYYPTFKVNESICDCAIELLSKYHLSHGLLIADAFIAATAIVINTPLLSKIKVIIALFQDSNSHVVKEGNDFHVVNNKHERVNQYLCT